MNLLSTVIIYLNGPTSKENGLGNSVSEVAAVEDGLGTRGSSIGFMFANEKTSRIIARLMQTCTGC